jgi:polysaccharide export outer membrane protein
VRFVVKKVLSMNDPNENISESFVNFVVNIPGSCPLRTRRLSGAISGFAVRKASSMNDDKRMQLLPSALSIVLLLSILNGCSVATDAPAPSANAAAMASASAESSQAAGDLERVARLWDRRTQQTSLKDYPIGPGDVLVISVPAMDEIKDRDVRVTADGTISLPFIGRLQAAGLTEAELADQLRPRLKEYLRNPRVFIFVKEYNSRQVAVLGAVVRPGLYNLTSGSENILDMISRAGGILPEAEPRIQLIPTEPLKGDAAKEIVSTLPVAFLPKDPASPILKKTEPILIDVKELTYGGHQIYLSLPVRPGDTIMVPGGAQVLVEGWVDKPGAFKMSPGLTVSGAVAAAGGALFAADTSTVKVIRPNRDGNKRSLVADLEKIKNGEMPDIGLQGGDIVQVSSSTAKLVPYGIYEFFKEIVRVGVQGTLIK